MYEITKLTGFAIAGGSLLLIAQPSWAQPAQITQIQLIPIEDGLQVILITSDPTSPEIFQFEEEDTLFVDIVGAQLALPEGGAFEQNNPVPSVASVTIEQVAETEVQIQIKTLETANFTPTAYLERSVQALILDIASTPPQQSAPTPDSDIDLRLIVTAQPLPRYQQPTASVGTRTETDILEIPQGVQSIPQEVIEDQGANSLGEVLRNTSGVSSGRSSSLTRASTPIIRGFETDNILRNGLRDDTLRLGAGVNNIERIEILKGPTSVLFGPGNLGGTINLVTEVPLAEPRYELNFTVGNNNRYNPAVDLTGSLNGSISYRLNSVYESQDSFKDFENGDFFFLAPTLQLIDTEKTSLIVDFEYLRNRTRENAPELPAVSAIGVEDNTLVENILDNGGQISEEDLASAGTLDVRANLGEPEISSSLTEITRISYRLDHQLSDTWRIRNEFLGSFQNTSEENFVVGVGFVQERGQPNFTLLDRVYLENPSDRDAYTLNTNVVGEFAIAGIDQTLLLGVEWFREIEEDTIIQRLFFPFLSPDSEPFNIFDPNYDRDRFFPGSDVNERIGSDSLTRRTTIGIYGQTQLNFSDQVILLLGGRLDFADQFFEDIGNRADPSPIETSDTALTPRVGLVYKPAENVSIYASYTESFNPTIGRSESGEVFTPEKGKQFEVGVKTRLFSDRLSATLAFYQLRRTNVLTQDPTNPGFQVQIGEQASDGIELDIAGELAPGWNIIASYAYTDARITEDNEFPEDRALINVPDHAASLWTSYQIQKGDLAGLGFGVGLYFQGDRNGDLRTPFIIPEYTRTDASIFYRKEDFRAQINFQNLFDIRYFEGARDQFRVIPGAPFTVFGSITWEF